MKRKIYILAGLAVIVDQITKLLVVFNFVLGEELTLIKNVFSFVYVRNNGGAFNIFSGNIIFLLLVSFGFIWILNKYILEKKTYLKNEIVLYGLLFGGIIGNMIDRIRVGYVIDFLAVKIFDYDFPVFNLADTFIVCSVIGLIYFTLKSGRKCKNGRDS